MVWPRIHSNSSIVFNSFPLTTTKSIINTHNINKYIPLCMQSYKIRDNIPSCVHLSVSSNPSLWYRIWIFHRAAGSPCAGCDNAGPCFWTHALRMENSCYVNYIWHACNNHMKNSWGPVTRSVLNGRTITTVWWKAL